MLSVLAAGEGLAETLLCMAGQWKFSRLDMVRLAGSSACISVLAVMQGSPAMLEAPKSELQ